MTHVKQEDPTISGDDQDVSAERDAGGPGTGLRPPQQERSKASLDRVLAAGAEVPTRDLVEGIVRILATVAHREAPLTQAFMERTTVEPGLIAHVKRLRTAPRRITTLLVERRADLNHDDPERAADMALWIATSAQERRVHTHMWRHWQPDADWDTFVADLVRVLQAFLLPPASMTPAAEVVVVT